MPWIVPDEVHQQLRISSSYKEEYMKRKLDQDNTPTPVALPSKSQTEPSFKSFGLDPRLLQATVEQGFHAPTPVQSKVIPLALEGKDIFGEHRPQHLLRINPAALILVPTHELAQQTSKVVAAFTAFCHKDIRTIDLSLKVPDSVQRASLASSPDIVIATPARATLSISTLSLQIDSLSLLIIDEADLVFSYGYEEDLQNIAKSIPSGIQTILLSATLTTEVNTIKDLYCRDPLFLDLGDQAEEKGGVTQYVVKCAEDEKFLLAFVIFKLKLIKGKCLIFVADIDRCYRLKLFLEQFGVKGCVLNSELPVNSRCHVVEEFNKSVYDIIIASDETEILGDEEQPSNAEKEPSPKPRGDHQDRDLSKSAAVFAGGKDVHAISPGKEASTGVRSSRPKKQRKTTKDGKDYGISRGIDFKNVACVLNFDLPAASKSYTHRIGRTARAGRTGMALSFVVPSSQYLKHKPTSTPSAHYDEVVLAKIIRHQQKKGQDVKPYEFDMKQVEAFKYRVNDALRSVTPIAVREARTRELRQEILKSERLKRHFEENPADLQQLKHDGDLRPARQQPHLKHIPDYLMPSNGRKGLSSGDIGFVGFRKTSENRIRKARTQKCMIGKGKKAANRKSDPLKTFKANGRR
ncbi:MAG: hypothetical protein LQ338_000501 [Usnochroma carphineum]|nr:MAG: hypothetical protein LQ338_000501 [Usnochroma carphineum]